MYLRLTAETKITLKLNYGLKIFPALFADRDLYNPTTFLNGANAHTAGLQTSRGCAEFGRRERETVWPAPTWLTLGYLKHITAVRDF